MQEGDTHALVQPILEERGSLWLSGGSMACPLVTWTRILVAKSLGFIRDLDGAWRAFWDTIT